MKTIICGIPFEVIEVESSLTEDQERFGECDVMAATIKINAHCSKAQKEATLVHEWIHAVAGCNGTSQSEDIVGVLATELYRQGFRVEVKA
jgi:hypothetical protein